MTNLNEKQFDGHFGRHAHQAQTRSSSRQIIHEHGPGERGSRWPPEYQRSGIGHTHPPDRYAYTPAEPAPPLPPTSPTGRIFGAEHFDVGEQVHVHSYGHWYPGQVVRKGRSNVHVEFSTGSGQRYTKSINPTKVHRSSRALTELGGSPLVRKWGTV